MTDAERIEQLKQTPRPPLTRWQVVGRIVSWVCSVVAVVAVCVSVYATEQAWHTATCVNGILGDRAVASVRDAQAHVTWAQSLARVLSADQAHVRAEYATFVKATNAYVAVLTEDQDFRAAHPLGHC